ncbi:hypothetical protein MNBD_GAMMA25-1506 [hydrothermal vent metagenome]|uniref:Uncharacterized protein n=1 Tax=hydrothermal vent metagenome TaxID=652676 RepID=A0A3B1ALS5_9ZZZZ
MSHYKILPAILFISSLLLNPVYAAPEDHQFTANFGVTSNYIFRGVSRSNNMAAASGGVDYSHKKGGYAGVWSSSMDGGDYELDLYGGYNGKTKAFKYDVGLIVYNYPGGTSYSDTIETYLNMDFSVMTLQAALTLDKQGTSQSTDIYLSAATELELKKDLALTLLLGTYQFDDPRYESYVHINATISKGEFSFALDQNDKSTPRSAGDLRFSAFWSRAFDL